MSDRSNWIWSLTGRLPGDGRAIHGGVERATADEASRRAAMDRQRDYWREETQRREQQSRAVHEAAAPFEERLRRLYLLAETAEDPVEAASYMSVAREMDQELASVADGLLRGRLMSGDLPKALDDWNSKGRAHLTHHGLHNSATQLFESASIVDARDEVWAWMDRGGVALGQTEMMARIDARANSAHDAGDRDISWQLANVVDLLDDSHQQDVLAAIETAVTLPAAERLTYLDSQEAALRQRIQAKVARLVDDLDLTIPEPVTGSAFEIHEETRRRQHQDRVENAVRAAYDVLTLRAEEAGEPDARWLSLADLRGELDRQAHEGGDELHPRVDIDAAVRRLSRNESAMVKVIPVDHEHVLTGADDDAAAQFDDGTRHLIRIDYPEYDQQAAEQTSARDNTTARTEAVGEISKEGVRGERSRAGVRPEIPRSFAPELSDVERDLAGPAL